MITTIIRERISFILIFSLITLAVVLPLEWNINTLQTEKDLCRISLQSVVNENQRLLDEKAQLLKLFWKQLKITKLLKNANQKVNEDKKDLQNEIEQIDTNLKTIEDNNKALLKDKKKLEKKINQTNLEF